MRLLRQNKSYSKQEGEATVRLEAQFFRPKIKCVSRCWPNKNVANAVDDFGVAETRCAARFFPIGNAFVPVANAYSRWSEPNLRGDSHRVAGSASASAVVAQPAAVIEMN